MTEPQPTPATAEAPSLASAARWVVILVGTFYLLRELGPILKPLFLAVLIGYVILPIHLAVKKRVPGRLSLADFHGLYDHSPALAVCFLVTGLASVGFPGTLGFVATELLVDGAVDWVEITRRNARSVQTTIGWIFWDPGAVARYERL